MLGRLIERSDLDSVAETAAQLARELLRAEGASVTRVRDTSIHYIAAVGAASNLLGRSLPFGDSFTGRVVARGEPMIYAPTDATESSRQRASSHGIGSGIVCPVFVEGEVAGTIGATSGAADAFGPESVKRLRELAEFVAVGLERNRSRRRDEQTFHFYRQSQLAAFVVRELDAPVATLTDALLRARAEVDESAGRLTTAVADALSAVESISRLSTDLESFVGSDDNEGAGPVEVNGVLARVASHFRDRIQAVAEFDVRLHDDKTYVFAAPSRVWQVAAALVSNAVEAIEAQPRGMHRVALRSSADRFTARFSVEDTGVGISTDAIPLLFEPFHTAKPNDRAGLGLTLAWRSVAAMGGTIDVESTPGEGSTFTVTLPRDVAHSESGENAGFR